MSLYKIVSVSTPVGYLQLVLRGDIVIFSGFGEMDEVISRSGVTDKVNVVKNHPYEKLVNDYFNGDEMALEKIPRQQDGSEFQKKVWNAISSVKYGKTISYKELAKNVGSQSAARAAGTACGRNRLVLLVPCHRILKNDGGLGNYLYGSDIKQKLLKLEGLKV